MIELGIAVVIAADVHADVADTVQADVHVATGADIAALVDA
jgi:hypothetical protein